jgi:hypothetical protein
MGKTARGTRKPGPHRRVPRALRRERAAAKREQAPARWASAGERAQRFHSGGEQEQYAGGARQERDEERKSAV